MASFTFVRLDAKPTEKKFIWLQWDNVKETIFFRLD